MYPKAAMENPMMDHFKQLLENGEDSDVVLKSRRGKEFRAHKVILSARSTVLKATLKERIGVPSSWHEHAIAEDGTACI